MSTRNEKEIDYEAIKFEPTSTRSVSCKKPTYGAITTFITLGLFFANRTAFDEFSFRDLLKNPWDSTEDAVNESKVVRRYALQVGTRWMNPDGGRWRSMYVCNGQSPCPTLLAEEGDIVEISVHSDSYFQSSMHWAGVGYQHTGAWNDGVAGVSQFPTLPRGNNTIVHDTQGTWGLNWYADHTSAASVDGLYGMVYVAPSPERERPYNLITNDPVDLKQIMDAEHNMSHLAIKNHQHRDTNWKLLRMRAEGSEYHCYNSIIINGKGRNLCRPQGYEELNGKKLDPIGCIQPEGLPDEPCTPSEADFDIIETEGRRYIMMNLLNIGFEHEVQVSVDNHKIAMIANDGGFVHPEMGDAVYVNSAGRITILIKLDQTPGDYTIRFASVSQLQNLQGFAILRYPAKRMPIYGEPMKLPSVDKDDICVLPDGTVPKQCTPLDPQFARPFPAQPPPSTADFTFHLSANSQKSQTEKHIPEYFLNEKPWPLFRGSMKPLLFTDLTAEEERKMLEKPVIQGIPMGSVVDLIIENHLNDSVPLYKHGQAAWLLGAVADDNFGYENVDEALRESNSKQELNMQDPALVVVHDLPPQGWSVLRFKVTAQAATMIHAVKLRYFLLGMSVPILEGITVDNPVSVPESAVKRPYVPFEPKNDGIFG